MTPEEIKAVLETEDGKKVLAEIGYESKDDVDRLRAKKNELLEKIADPKLKEAKHKAKMFEEIIQAAGVESQDNAGEEILSLFEKARNPEEPEEIRQLKREHKKLLQEFSELSEENKATLGSVKNNLVDNVFIQLLQADGCTLVQAKAAKAHILGETGFDLVKADTGTRKAVDELGRTPKEYYSEWVKSEEAKELLPAKLNTGAGAKGSRGGSLTPDYREEINKARARGDKAAVIRLTREQQDALKNAHR